MQLGVRRRIFPFALTLLNEVAAQRHQSAHLLVCNVGNVHFKRFNKRRMFDRPKQPNPTFQVVALSPGKSYGVNAVTEHESAAVRDSRKFTAADAWVAFPQSGCYRVPKRRHAVDLYAVLAKRSQETTGRRELRCAEHERIGVPAFDDKVDAADLHPAAWRNFNIEACERCFNCFVVILAV